MEIDDFISLIERSIHQYITRGAIIDYIADNEDLWILVVKALLIKNTKRYIHKDYLLQKLKFMKNHPEKAYTFLDIQGLSIFYALRGDD